MVFYVDVSLLCMLLSEFQPNDCAKICGFAPGDKHYRQKLLSMGLTKGTEFIVLRKAPLGDPIHIQVRGFSLSLRKQEAAILLLERVVR